MDLFIEFSTDPEELYGQDFINADADSLLSKINSMDTLVEVSAKIEDVTRYLALQGKLTDILYYADQAADPRHELCKKVILTVEWCTPPKGNGRIDLSTASGQTMLGGLVVAELITQDEATYLADLNKVSMSRAEILFGAQAQELDVRRALWNDDGSRRTE